LFKTLLLSKAHDDIFLYSILGAPTGKFIKLLIFDHFDGHDLANFVCQICPRLPNLRSILGLNTHFAAILCLSSHRVTASSSNIASYLKGQRVRQALVQIASQVKVWDIKLDEEDTELLLSQNSDGIESLILRTDEHFGLPIFESEESKFPFLLSKCSKLQQLSINQTHSHDNYRSNFDPVVDSVLTTSFPFAATLRSLSLDLERYGGRTTSNELELPTLFPSLEVLKITFHSDNLDEIASKSFLLPKLTSLEVLKCPFLHMHILIHCLDLPSISKIYLAQTDFGTTTEERIDEMRKLVSELGAYSFSLRALHLTSHGIPRCVIEELKGLKGDITIHVNTELVSFSSETVDTSIRANIQLSDDVNDGDLTSEDYSDDQSDSDVSDPAQRRYGGIEQDLKLTKELLTWAQERVNGCEDVDDAGMEEMMRVLEPVQELKAWLED